MDFSNTSGGNPKSSSCLHYFVSGKDNEYQRAIRALFNVFAPKIPGAAQRMFPVYGFGACLPAADAEELGAAAGGAAGGEEMLRSIAGRHRSRFKPAAGGVLEQNKVVDSSQTDAGSPKSPKSPKSPTSSSTSTTNRSSMIGGFRRSDSQRGGLSADHWSGVQHDFPVIVDTVGVKGILEVSVV